MLTVSRYLQDNDNADWNVSFWFWFLSSLKITFVALLFRSNPAAGTLFNFIISLFFLLFVFFEWLGKHRVLEFSPAVKLIYAYLAWAGLSLLWTRAESTATAAFYWVGVVLDVAVVWFMLHSSNRRRVIEGGLRGIVFGGVILGGLLFFFETGADGRAGDEIIHVNSIGNQIGLASIASLFFISGFHERGDSLKKWYGVIIFLLLCLIYSLSKTSIVAVGVAIVIYTVMGKGVKGSSIALLSCGALLLVIFWPTIEVYLDAYMLPNSGGSLSTAETLTGRTLLWEEVWLMIGQAPIVGYGFFSFRDVGPDIFSVMQTQAHNELLQQWFSLGIVGVVLALAVYCMAALHWWGIRRDPVGLETCYAIVGLTLLVYSIARGITEASVVSLVFPLPMMLILLSKNDCNTN